MPVRISMPPHRKLSRVCRVLLLPTDEGMSALYNPSYALVAPGGGSMSRIRRLIVAAQLRAASPNVGRMALARFLCALRRASMAVRVPFQSILNEMQPFGFDRTVG
jgi:hypothetical protein